MAKQDDGLFLLEVLVDKVIFLKSPCFSDKDFRTCVNIQCPAVDPLEICDDDPGSCFAKGGGPFEKSFNSGKSCLFSLQEADISKAMSSFPIKITVYKSLPCGCLPTKIIMGEATIDMTKEFVQARKKFLEDPTSVSYEALKDSFRLLGLDKAEAGEIMMFLRISCFGKLIITRFQGGSSPPNLTGGGGSSIVDRSCFPRKDFQTSQNPCVCGAAKSGTGPGGSGAVCDAPCKPGAQMKGFGVCPPAKDPYNTMPCEDPDDPCYCTGPKPPKKSQMECRNTHQYCLHVPKDCCPAGNKVIFQLPSDSCAMNHKQRAHFNTSAGVGDVARDEPGQFMPTTADDYPGVVYDFSDQVVKLCIKKFVEMPGRKSKLEYKFITPAGQEKVIPVRENRTAQYTTCCSNCCPAKPCCAQPSLPFHQDMKQEQIMNIESSIYEEKELKDFKTEDNLLINLFKAGSSIPYSETLTTINDDSLSLSMISFQEEMDNLFSFGTNSCRVTFSNELDYGSKSCNDFPSQPRNLFGKEEMVFMTLLNDYRIGFIQHRTSGTQATASVNKCLQVSCMKNTGENNSLSKGWSSGTMSSFPYAVDSTKNILPEKMKHSDIYYYERNKAGRNNSMGMGFTGSKTKCRKFPCSVPCGMRSDCGIQAKSASCTSGAQTKPCCKAVSIKDDKCAVIACPAVVGGGGKSEMIGTVSHVRIGPKEPCPTTGLSPCIGPGCMLALSEQDNQAPVRVTNASNPRRGVFEIVIRKLTGAPLAKNELMLEWTPPPACRPPLCDGCTPCPVPLCRPPKCKMIACRPCKLPKCCKKKCKRPCGPPCKLPCGSPCKVPCGLSCRLLCGLPCGMPCRLPCGLPCKRPCRPRCRKPCKKPCRSPCKSPCRSPCPSPCRRCRSPCKPLCGASCRPPYRPPCSSPPCKQPCGTPCRSPCGSPCGSPCSSPCRPICPSPCGPPCGPPCGSPCGSPCRPRCRRPKPCRYRCKRCCKKPPSCKPCSRPCPSPCGSPPCCKSSCKSSPCLRPCPVGYKKPRKIRSQPRMKPHRKKISPCCNRVLGCAAARCRSGPCIGFCATPCLTRRCSTIFYCPSRKCCSVSPCG